MNFKEDYWKYSQKEYESLYADLESIAQDRLTDLNTESIDFILDQIHPSSETILDVGCGRGEFLHQVKNKFPHLRLMGADVYRDEKLIADISFHKANIESLPFGDRSIDVVTCHHTLEHVLDLPKSISELRRIAKKQLILTVPCQRNYKYNFDLHINFFTTKAALIRAVNLPRFACEKIQGDIVYSASIP